MRRNAGVMWCALVSLCGPAAAQDMAEIKARGALRVVAVADEQPEMFSFQAGGQPGFEREMLEGFAKLQGLAFEVVQAPRFEDRIPMLLDGRGDVAIGMVVTPERAAQIDFTVQVLPVRHVVVNHEPAAKVASVEEFRGLKVGILAGTTWAKAAAAAGATQTESFSDLDVLLAGVRDGKVAATVMTVSDFTLATKRYPGLQAGVFLDEGGQAAWGVRKGSPALRQALDAHLENLRKGPSWSRLVVKYFGEKALDVLGRR
jgi:ABC-type amino acid transport substrate-binding protein